MMLIVKTIEMANVAGQRAFVLCDENGNPLPCQKACDIRQVEGELSTITVTFAIDGKSIRIEDRA